MGAPDQYELSVKHKEEREQTAKGLQYLFESADQEGTGRISQADFARANADGRMTDFLEMLDFQYQDVMDFLQMSCSHSDTGDNKVNIKGFVRGCMHMRGSATNFDMKSLMMELREIHSESTQMIKEMHALMRRK